MIKLSGVSKIYQSGSTEIKALNNIYLDIKKGEFAVVLEYQAPANPPC